MREYRCTRKALYSHQCIGHDNIEARQGHYIWAINEEAAWQEMAQRYPDETEAGFTVEPWEGFNVKVVEVKRDENGNVIE
ncbi:hypothetical protein [Fischerella sp. PCC 9605]|uniref:hypothetical protein n=1 Tax=Fischerella sp. PCC 9605 TaxID=1173024 RepID=UPI0004798A80|nr:hypothetical protein [Fischerella sp. PCC 9605]